MELTSGIVCILCNYKRPVGTGFVVSTATESLIVTCAHVLGEPIPEQVTVVFQATGERREAKVIDQWCRSQVAEDVAILRLIGDPPQHVQPFLLGTASGTRGHIIHTFGFPNIGEVEGAHGTGEVLGLGAKTRAGQPLLQLRSSEITQGFSGAPIWDEVRRRVIGMVVRVAPPDASGKLGETAFATSTETLQIICPDLLASDICPYRNLGAFTEADAAFFFGRQRVVDEMVNSLRSEPRFLALLGPSGSGKSSVVQAGLIPQLREGKLPGSDRWEVIVTRPTDQSFRQILNTLAQEVAIRRVLVIDQFEELFVTSSEAECQSLVARLIEFLESASPLTIVITIRDDFYSSFVRYEVFARRLRRALINIPATLTYEEVIDIIEKPAQVVGVHFELGLAEIVAKDTLETASPAIARRKDASSTVLPLLEFALTQLWERRCDGLLTHHAYKAIGRVTGGLTQWADREFYSLNEEQRSIARRIFTNLVHLGSESQGLPDSSRRRSLSSLLSRENERETAQYIIRKLAKARLLVTSRDVGNNEEIVELIHEALLREWGLFTEWIREDHRFLLWYQKFEQRFQEWKETQAIDAIGHDADKLLRGRDLSEAEDWLKDRVEDLNRAERDFIAASGERKRLEEQREKELQEKTQITLASRLERQAEWIRETQTHKLQLSMLLATESMQRCPSPSANKLLSEGLAMLPRSVAHLIYGKRLGSVSLSPDGHLLAVANGGNLVEVYDMPYAHKIAQLEHDDWAWDVTFSPDSHLLATASRDHGVRIWSLHGDIIAQLNHDHQALTVTFSSDGLYLAATYLDHTARVWSLKDMQEYVRFVHRNGVTATFSPDSRYLAVGSDWPGEDLTLFELSNRQCIPIPPPYRLGTWTNHVTSFVFSPDGRYLVIVLTNGPAVVCDLANEMKHTYLEQEGDAIAVAFSPDGKFLASSSDNGMVQVWRAYGKNAFGKYPKASMQHNERVEVVIFNSDGTLIATASDDQTARVWEVSSGKQLLSVAHEGTVRGVIFSQDGRYLVTSSNDDGTVRIWDTKSVSQSIRLTHDGPVGALSFNSDGTLIATASDDQTAKIWKAQNGSQVACLSHEGKVRSIVFNPADNNLVVTASRDKTAKVWSARNGSELASLSHKDEVWKVIFSSDGRYFATSGRDQTARVWKATNNRLTAGLLPNGVIEGIALSSDGHYLATTSGNTLRVLNTQTNKQNFSPYNFFNGHSVCFSPNGRYLAAASGSYVKVWDMATGNELRSLKHDNTVWAIIFSPDGRYLSTAGEDCTARVWDAADGTQIAQFTHNAMVWDVKFSPKGLYLATASWDCTAGVWDILSDRQIACFTHEDRVIAIAFSPDGKYLATASHDHTARIWLWRPNDIVTEVCSRLTRNLTPEEWKQYLGDEPYCKMCPSLP